MCHCCGLCFRWRSWCFRCISLGCFYLICCSWKCCWCYRSCWIIFNIQINMDKYKKLQSYINTLSKPSTNLQLFVIEYIPFSSPRGITIAVVAATKMARKANDVTNFRFPVLQRNFCHFSKPLDLFLKFPFFSLIKISKRSVIWPIYRLDFNTYMVLYIADKI